jgi:hypothetical protein
MTVEGRKKEIGPGDVFCVPRGVVHRSDNFHSGAAKVLVIITPGILGPDYFHEMANRPQGRSRRAAQSRSGRRCDATPRHHPGTVTLHDGVEPVLSSKKLKLVTAVRFVATPHSPQIGYLVSSCVRSILKRTADWRRTIYIPPKSAS